MKTKAKQRTRLGRIIGTVAASPREQRRIVLLLVLFFLIVFVLSVSFSQLGNMYSKSALAVYEPGKVAEKDLILYQDITYIDEEATRVKEQAELELVYPIYEIDEKVTQKAMDNLGSFLAGVDEIHNDRLTPKEFHLQLQKRVPQVFTEEEAVKMFPFLSRGFSPALEILQQIQGYGIFSIPDNSADEFIDIWRWQQGSKVHDVVHRDQLYLPDKVQDIAIEIATEKGYTQNYAHILGMICNKFKRENGFYNQDRTEMARERVLREVEPVLVKLSKGDVVIRKGFIVTPEDMKHVKAISSYSFALNIYGILGTGLFVFGILLLAVVLLSPPMTERKLTVPEKYLVLGLAFTYTVLMIVSQKLTFIQEYRFVALILPTSLIAMLVSILIRPRVGIMLSLALSFAHLLVEQNPLASFLYAFLSGVIGTYLVVNAEKRLDLVRATFLLASMDAALMVFIGIFGQFPIGALLTSAGIAALNGFLCGILNLGLLPFFEHMMNVPTPFRLMELSDLNTPLFKRMITLAPGTYGHSVAVANLAESASREIGANPLLARVGAYYHDIGKIDQAEYFIENQAGNENKHDELKPSLSAAVIKSHVKIGMEKARELSLPQAVIDIIEQHHGSGLISYFYSEALKDNDDQQNVNPEDYSYSGSPPLSKEAAVVMLADTIEAASRTLKKPTVAKLEKFIWKHIMDRFTSGQMNYCDLTFKDLEIIKNTFVQILAGHFHSRIEYPDMKEDKVRSANGDEQD